MSAEPRIVLRPIGTPLPLGFLGLTVATVAFSAVQLGWIPPDQGRTAALAALVFAVPLQLLAAVFGFLSRDPIAGTGMGVLAAAWAVTGAVTLVTAPGASSSGLGVVLLAGAAALVVPVVAGASKVAAAAVMAVAAARFAVTGIAELTGAVPWRHAAGIAGLALGLVALYAALAFELEGVRMHAVLPVLRRGPAADALRGDADTQVSGVAHEAGVRQQL